MGYRHLAGNVQLFMEKSSIADRSKRQRQRQRDKRVKRCEKRERGGRAAKQMIARSTCQAGKGYAWKEYGS
jgi:hypothetical protein